MSEQQKDPVVVGSAQVKEEPEGRGTRAIVPACPHFS